MTETSFLLMAAGIVALVAGATGLVRGASRLAAAFGVSPLVIGLTVVSFGTSSPEAAVSIGSALGGEGHLALGNVIGSNIFNILLILGITALVSPITVSEQLIRLDVPVMVGVSALVLLIGLDGRIGRLEGLLLLAGVGAYTIVLLRIGRRDRARPVDQKPAPAGAARRDLVLDAVYIVAGLVLLGVGARWLVEGATRLAASLGIGELVVGLTVVAAGTSLPELAASIAAAVRGERDIAVGNVVGSNIYNLLLVLGVASVLAPAGVPVSPAALTFDLPVMVAVAVACVPIFFTGNRISRREGAVFVAYFVAYTAFVVLDATDHQAFPVVSGILLLFVVPLTAWTLGVVLIRELHRRAGGGNGTPPGGVSRSAPRRRRDGG